VESQEIGPKVEVLMSDNSPGVKIDEQLLGQQLFACVADLYPICRSITGDGVRETLSYLSSVVPLNIHEVPTGTAAFDWVVPKEWTIRDAYIKDAQGKRVVDFRESNLHVLNYSTPVRGVMSLTDLRPHLFTLPEHPEWIPYRTSYYEENWGFCLSQNQLDVLPEGDYEVCIDSSLEPGALTYGELLIPGESTEEVLISCHICHPSLANDNLSGIAVAAFAARHLQSQVNRYSYRFLFIPGTIGSLVWLSKNESTITNIRHGLVLTCLGDAGTLTYKRCRSGEAVIDRAAAYVLKQQSASEILDFSPYGYDERQYCSPGFNLPVGRLSRTPHGRFPEYHTSADNLDFVRPTQLAGSLQACLEILEILERNRVYLNQKPMGEPHLSKYWLYESIGGDVDANAYKMALLWVLNLSDGKNSLLEIAERAGLGFQEVVHAANALSDQGLLQEA
jgi:aminopeptidase-like protein